MMMSEKSWLYGLGRIIMMKKPVRIIALVLCLAAALFVLPSCDDGSVKASDQSKSPLIHLLEEVP